MQGVCIAMKILHVLNHSTPHTDGYCIRSKCIVRFQREMGWQPVVVTSPHHEPVPSGPLETFDDIRYYRTPTKLPGFPVVHEWVGIGNFSRRILEVIDVERPDIV